jgi:glycosyltransferase involved in cell wall biosynthesis
MTNPFPRAQLSGSRILVLNWRDIRHPQAGGAEQYMHEIGRRWAENGADITWFTARPPDQPVREVLDGMRVLRFGGPLSLYPRTAVRLLRTRGLFDAVIDCQNGIPFFSPVFVGEHVPVVQVVHHVHQDQFATRFSAPMAAIGRALEGRAARWVYRNRTIVAVSPSTRTALRDRLAFGGRISVVPNGTVPVPASPGPRDPEPTVVVVSRLVPHKRLELLLSHVAEAIADVPRLRVDIVGDGPERARLQGLVVDLGLQSAVTLHGRLSDGERDQLLSRAWLTVSTSAAEGWGCSVLEAAAWGVPCLALRAPGICDSVLEGRTGWLVDRPRHLGQALSRALHQLADERRAAGWAAACQDWARRFSWDRSAELMAGVVQHEMVSTARRSAGHSERRHARSDAAVLARFRVSEGRHEGVSLRTTDQVVADGDRMSVLLNACDDFDAARVLQRFDALEASLSLVEHHELLSGPVSLALPENGDPVAETGIRA